MIWTGPHGPGPDTRHRDLARILPASDREWLARMADVLPWGWVIPGMAVPARGDVVCDPRLPGGCRLIVAPTGPSGAASAYARGGYVAPVPRPSRPSPTVGVRW